MVDWVFAIKPVVMINSHTIPDRLIVQADTQAEATHLATTCGVQVVGLVNMVHPEHHLMH